MKKEPHSRKSCEPKACECNAERTPRLGTQGLAVRLLGRVQGHAHKGHREIVLNVEKLRRFSVCPLDPP